MVDKIKKCNIFAPKYKEWNRFIFLPSQPFLPLLFLTLWSEQ